MRSPGCRRVGASRVRGPGRGRVIAGATEVGRRESGSSGWTTAAACATAGAAAGAATPANTGAGAGAAATGGAGGAGAGGAWVTRSVPPTRGHRAGGAGGGAGGGGPIG